MRTDMAKRRKTAGEIAAASASRSSSKVLWLLVAASVALFLVFYLRTRARTLSNRMLPAQEQPVEAPGYVEQAPAEGATPSQPSDGDR